MLALPSPWKRAVSDRFSGAQPLSTWVPQPVTPTLPTDELHLWQIHLDLDVSALGHLSSLLSPDEVERASRFIFVRDRNRFVASRARLRQILCAYLRAAPQELGFDYESHGKPSLKGLADGEGLSFNLTHSGPLAIYAFAQSRRVGVDVEHVRHDLDYRPLLNDVCSFQEQQAITELPDALGRAIFYQKWVCKEAYVKATGQGFSYPLTNVEVALQPGAPPALCLPIAAQSTQWTLYMVNPSPNYVASAVVEGQDITVRLFKHVDGAAL